MVTRRKRNDAVFHAIAEPTRRRLLDALARGPRSAGSLARRFPASRPAIARHLRVLRAARLVRARAVGRRRIYELTPAPLHAVESWVAHYAAFWSGRLDALARYVESEEGREER